MLFQEDRIATHWCDQTDPASIARMWASVPVPAFDLMIDDGLHTVPAGICLFENAIHRLRDGGIDIIEDVDMQRMMEFMVYFGTKPYTCEFVHLRREELPLGDNALIVIRK